MNIKVVGSIFALLIYFCWVAAPLCGEYSSNIKDETPNDVARLLDIFKDKYEGDAADEWMMLFSLHLYLSSLLETHEDHKEELREALHNTEQAILAYDYSHLSEEKRNIFLSRKAYLYYLVHDDSEAKDTVALIIRDDFTHASGIHRAEGRRRSVISQMMRDAAKNGEAFRAYKIYLLNIHEFTFSEKLMGLILNLFLGIRVNPYSPQSWLMLIFAFLLIFGPLGVVKLYKKYRQKTYSP